MTLIMMVLRKMLKNKWFILFLMIGLLISSALMSSIPMYTQGVLQKVFIKDLENYQKENETFPGSFSYSLYLNDGSLGDVLNDAKGSKNIFESDKVKKYFSKYKDDFVKFDDYAKEKFDKQMPLPILEKVMNYSTEPRKMVHDNFKQGDFDDTAYSRIQSLNDVEKHIKLTDGRLPAKEKVDGVYEVLVSEGALNKLKMLLDRVYVLSDVQKKGFEAVKIKPVGVFEAKQGDDLYWSAYKISNLDESVIMDENLLLKDFIKTEHTHLDSARWFFELDYHSIKLSDISSIYGGENNVVRDLSSIRDSISIDFPLKDLTSKYLDKEKQLKTMMWSLNVPVIIMLSIYLFMVSKLIIDKEKNEISLLISRGASRIQVVFGYVVEGLLLAFVSIVLGPVLGLFLTKLLGASNGFLEFVNRKSLDIGLSLKSYQYALMASVIFMITLLVPAYKASSTSIVDHKRKKARGEDNVLWQKIFLDVILLAISGYGYYQFAQRQQIVKAAAAAAGDMQVDPVLFFIPVLFILGISLLCLRLYPLFLRIVYKLGKKLWTPSMYGTLVQVSRASISYNFIMVFIMLTLSIGIFSATAARTINKNAEDRLLYKNGADLVLQPMWDKIESGGASTAAPYSQAKEPKQEESAFTQKTIQYIEPSFEPYQNLPGVEHAAKVLTKEKVWVQLGKKSSENVSLMAIEPYDFGNVEWYRTGLLPHHINEYLNLLSAEESACIISKSLSDVIGAKPGDSINISIGVNKPAVVNVYEVVDYWPSETPKMIDDKISDPNFIITNLSYIQDRFPKEPYNIWLKLKEKASRQELYKAIAENKLMMISSLKDTRNEIVDLKNNPSQLAINGSLTMGFLISGVICFLGFVLYWVLSLKERSLQFGILRAIGLSSSQLKLMMLWEQALTSGIAMLLGTAIGLVCSKIYVSFFQVSSSYVDQIPPFKVVSYANDRLKVYGFIGFTFILGLGILVYMLSRIKISNVIKLGED